jgi:hypothetical protein
MRRYIATHDYQQHIVFDNERNMMVAKFYSFEEAEAEAERRNKVLERQVEEDAPLVKGLSSEKVERCNGIRI